MFKSETESTEVGLSYRSNLGKSTAFLKAGARLTILSVLSNKVKNQSAILLNKEKAKQGDSLETTTKLQKTKDINTKDNLMASTCQVPVVDAGNVVKGDMKEHGGPMGMVNGIPEINGNDRPCDNPQVASKNLANSYSKHGPSSSKGKTPFDFMSERKLSEPVLSPRKRANAMSSKMTRCRSTVDLRENEKPIMRELGGYKFYQRPGEVSTTSKNRKTNSYRSNNENNPTDIASLRKTIEQQKQTIANREKYVLQLEKRVSTLEGETTKCKKQVESLRGNIQEYSSTLDFMRREKDAWATEKDRLNLTLLSYEDQLNELQATNRNLVAEYEHSEQSRMIAVSHIHDIEKSPEDSEKLLKVPGTIPEKLKSMKDCVQKLRDEKQTLQNEQERLRLFFKENMQAFVDRVGELERKQKKSGEKGQSVEQGTVKLENVGEKGKDQDENVEEDSFEASDSETDLVQFKAKLKSNENMIDQLANDIRDLENKKKGLLESRFAMIQKFQARQTYLDEDLEEEDGGENGKKGSEEEGDDEEMSERGEKVNEMGKSKESYRVTRKIRKLERTLSMDHGVGKLDCIQKLCKKLEDCEQKIQELETVNADLREENDDMEEEAKYLKYVLSYRGDTMKAQLEQEYQAKMAAFTEELRVAKETNADESLLRELRKRNQTLEGEVQRLHEELKSLLINLPALQGGDEQRAQCACDGNTSRKISDMDEVVRSLEEKVTQLSEEKQVLLLSMQTLSAHSEAGEPENDQSFSKSLLVLEKSLRDVENENACFLETFQRIREVLELDDEDTGAHEHVDSVKISKLKGEMQRLSEKADTRLSTGEESAKEEVPNGHCVRHEERLSELGEEVVRLHEEKKSLLTTIIRLQADPNFTFSDDVTDSEVSGRSSLASPGTELLPGDDGWFGTPQGAKMAANSSLPPQAYCDKEVQVGISCDDFEGLLGYLEQDLARLKTALSEQGIVGRQANNEPKTTKAPYSRTGQNGIAAAIEELTEKVEEFEEQNRVLQEKLGESEAIRSDLHRTISIATDMATEERLKCSELIKTKTALEKDMIKLAKDNQDLRDGLETLSRVRKRRNSRVQYMSLASPACEGTETDGPSLYLPLINSTAEQSDTDISISDTSKC